MLLLSSFLKHIFNPLFPYSTVPWPAGLLQSLKCLTTVVQPTYICALKTSSCPDQVRPLHLPVPLDVYWPSDKAMDKEGGVTWFWTGSRWTGSQVCVLTSHQSFINMWPKLSILMEGCAPCLTTHTNTHKSNLCFKADAVMLSCESEPSGTVSKMSG